MKAIRTSIVALLCMLMPFPPGVAQQIAQDSQVLVVPAGDKFFQWFGHQGRTYFFQASDPNDHLRSWIWSDAIESGNDQMISYEIGGTSDKSFFRLHYTDALPPSGVSLEQWDADGDGLGNALELTLQGNPLNTDSSGDGIPDDWTHAHGLALNQNNADGLFQGGPHTNLEAYQSGVPADPNATFDDHDGDGVDNDEDADPNDPDVDWEPANVSAYALVEIEVPEEAGYARDFNNAGDVLFDGGLWKFGTWLELDQVEIEGEYEDFTYNSTYNGGLRLSPRGDIIEGGTFNLYGPTDFEARHVLRRSYDDQTSTYTSASSTLQTLDWQNGLNFLSIDALGEDATERLFVVKEKHVALPAETAPAIWILDGNLAHVGTYQVPAGYRIFYHGNQVTPSGWLAVNANPHTNNTPAARTIVWNPIGQEITTGGGLPWYFTGLSELPHGKPALACRYHGANGSVYLLNDNEDAFKNATKLSGKNIHTFAGDGTAMTWDGKMWINGELIPIRDLCPTYGDLLDDGWSFQIHKANKHGLYLIEAHKDDQSLPMLMVPAALNAKQAGASETEEGIQYITLSDPKPEVEISVDGSFVNAQGALEIHVSGSVRDYLSEVLATDRISQLSFKVNGNVVHTIQLSYGQGDAPWTLADSTNEFSEILTIPYPMPGGYEVRAETDENGAGNIGWGKVAVGLAREDDPSAVTEVFSDLSVALSTVTTDTAVDQMTVYYGDRAPQAGDAIFTETAVDSGVFTGTLLVGGVSRACEIDMQPADGLGPADLDHLAAEISYELPGGARVSSFISFEESAADSLRFRPDGFRVTGERNTVMHLADLPASQGGGLESVLMKVALPDAWAAAQSITVLVNSQEHSLKKFTYGGKEEWYVVGNPGDNRPKIFIPCHKDLPSENAFPDVLVPGEYVKWELVINGVPHPMADTLILGGIPDPAPPVVAVAAAAQSPPESPEASEAGSWKEPGDTVNWTDLVTAYKFIYPDEISQALLKVYLSQDHEISLEDVLGNFKFSYRWRIGNKALIKIENDDNDIHPGICAQYLWRGLNNALTIYSFREALAAELNEAGLEIDAMIAYKAQVGPAAAETGVAAAELYLSGIGILNEPLDWILVVNDVSEGHYSSLAAALPFISRGMITATKGIKIQSTSGEVLETIENVAKLDAVKSLYRETDLRVMGVTMEGHQFSDFLRKVVVGNGGPVQVPKHHRGLREAMQLAGPIPAFKARAHHDFPWAQREWFAKRGIDVNNPAFGRWVGELDHKLWHERSTPKFNEFWQDYINDSNNLFTMDEILQKLAECRNTYPVSQGLD